MQIPPSAAGTKPVVDLSLLPAEARPLRQLRLVVIALLLLALLLLALVLLAVSAALALLRLATLWA